MEEATGLWTLSPMSPVRAVFQDQRFSIHERKGGWNMAQSQKGPKKEVKKPKSKKK